jgi:hypothetical protein
MQDKTLIVIYGQVRTFEITGLSIYQKIIMENHPCHVLLAIDGRYSDIPQKILTLLDPYLLDVYTTHLKTDDDIPRDHNRIEFILVKNALDKLTPIQKEEYMFMVKVRTDMYIREKICLKRIYCRQSLQQFQIDWTNFTNHENIIKLNPKEQLKAWFLTGGGLNFFLKRYNQNYRPVSPWSLSDVIEWNNELWKSLDNVKKSLFAIHKYIRKIAQEQKIVYLIGSSWVHFGYFHELDTLSNTIAKDYGTFRWNDDDEALLEWTDHKGVKRSKTQKHWRWITDDQLRLCHFQAHSLIDIVNPQDYIESFDSWHTLKENVKNENLFAFIVRKHQLT